MSEQIDVLNQIIQMVDEKATKFKDGVIKMKPVQRAAEKKLLLDLIDNGLKLAESIKPKPLDLVGDLKRLAEQIGRLG